MKGESRQGPLNRLQGRDSDSHLAARCGSHPHHTQVSPVEGGRRGLVGGRVMDREDGGWTPAGLEGGEEMLAQKEGNRHILVIVGLSQIIEREKPKVTPGTNPVPEF